MTHVVCPNCQVVNRVPEERMADGWQRAKCPKCGTSLFPGKPINATGSQLRRIVERSGIPVVVDVWAAWCGPCRMMAPAFAEAAGSLAPTVLFLKLDSDAEQQASAELGIRSIPTMILFSKGREVARQSGAMSTSQIVQWIQQSTD